MASDDLTTRPPTAPNQAILFPAHTGDYRVSRGKFGLSLVATRKIQKGRAVFPDSLEYAFANVEDGDALLLDGYQKASQEGKVELPQYVSISRETLFETHGVPTIRPDPTGESGGIISWLLEVPGMLMNHSCDANTTDYPPCVETGEAFAARTIQVGEELTCDYALLFYNEPCFDTCECGAPNCRGEVKGFSALSDEEKERLFPAATKAVQAMYLADIGKGPPVKVDRTVCASRLPSGGVIRVDSIQYPKRGSTEGVLRLVVPPPSCSTHAKQIAIKPNSEGELALYATRDFSVGDEVYECWNQTWPDVSSDCFDMVFASPVEGNDDPPEGTVVRMDAHEFGVPRNQDDHFRFSGWELLTRHSCEPNMAYDDDEDTDDESNDDGFWRSACAVKHIKEGEELTVDYNTMLWDGTESTHNIDKEHRMSQKENAKGTSTTSSRQKNVE